MKLMTIVSLWVFVAVAALALHITSCQKEDEEDAYRMEDFSRVRKIDAHVHVNSEGSAFVDLAAACGFRIFSVNVDYPDFPPVALQQQAAEKHRRTSPEVFAYASTFSMAGYEEKGWAVRTIGHLDSTLQAGASAVKFWKNIGMVERNKAGALVMIDDPGLDPVFGHLIDSGIPIICHCGEPRDCWLAVPEMMSNDMKEYFSHHPQYHMNLHPEMPSYADQIEARNRRVEKNPAMVFLGAHLGSLEWSVDTIAAFLERHPGASVDLAARMDYLQLQSQKDRAKVRTFFKTYKDRLVYATDLILNPADDTTLFRQVTRDKWLSDWKYLATDSVMTVPPVSGTFQGLNLPRAVIDRLYRENAERLFKTAWKTSPAAGSL